MLDDRNLIKYSCVSCGEEILDTISPVKRYELQGNYCDDCIHKTNMTITPWAYSPVTGRTRKIK